MSGIFSGIGAALGGTMSGSAAQEQLAAETKLEDTNLQLKAQQAREQGAFESGRVRAETGKLVSSQGVAYTNSGVDAGVGTAAQVQANTAALGELDAQQIQNNASRAAWGFAESRRALQDVYRAKKTQTEWGMASTILGGAGQFAGGVASFGAK